MTNQALKIKRFIACVLVITLITPTITIAANSPWEDIPETITEDSPWLNMPVIEPYSIDPISPAEFAPFDAFATDIQTYLQPFDLPRNELSEPSTAELEAFLQSQGFGNQINEAEIFEELLRQGLPFHALEESDRRIIFNQLNISQDTRSTAEQQLATMYYQGFTLYESIETLRIMSSNLFSFYEAQSLLRLLPSSIIRQSELMWFELFALRLDAAGQQGMLDNARHLFLQGHGVSEIEAAFALGAALHVPPETFLLTPGSYHSSLALQTFGYTSPSALSVRIDGGGQRA